MIQTVLEIGKKFYESEENYKYHKYINQCLTNNKNNKIKILSIPVDTAGENFSFKIDEVEEIIDENIIKDKLFYLIFKTSDADTTINYIYGDIYYAIDKNGKEKTGNYRIKDEKNTFEQVKKKIKGCKNKTILNFRIEFERQKEKIDKIILNIKDDNAIFLHFNFNDWHFKYWYNKDEIDEIDRLLIGHFFEKSRDNKDNEIYMPKTMLHRTICTGNDKNDIQFPNFNKKNKYKSCFFSYEDARNSFYAIKYTEKPLIKIKKTDINIIALPKGNNLLALDYEKFNKYRSTLEDVTKKESEIVGANKSSEELLEGLFEPLINDSIAKDVIEFDLIFSKQGKQSSPWIDIIELSGIEKSDLQRIKKRIDKIGNKITDNNKQHKNLNIQDSFYKILGDMSKSQKYKNHLCKVLPQIYTETYYNDKILLHALIEKTEYNIRTGLKFAFLKEDFYFLTMIQNNNKEGENLMKIQESQSYKIGNLLGKLALPFANWRNDCPIKSFEKSYIGNLSRRISTLEEFIKFKNFIDEKLTIHEKLYKSTKDTSYQLAHAINNFSDRYNKDECSFGFFEAYFEPIQNNNNKTEEN